MTEPYYNVSSHGTGIEGFMNYANVLVDGWMATAFITFIWLITLYVGSKSEWEIKSVLAFSFFLSLITIMILRLFTIVNEVLIFVCIFGLGVSVFLMVIDKK